jgi:hypothetical protein
LLFIFKKLFLSLILQMPAPLSPTQALSAALQLKSPRNMAHQSSAQALMNAMKSKESSKSLCSAQTLINAIQTKENSSAAQNIVVYTICETEKPRRVSKADKDSSKALKDLLEISSQTLSSTPIKLTFSQSSLGTQPSAAKTTPPGKDTCSVNQKEKKTKVAKERTKSRSNSEDADFYAGSAALNSPSPHFVPLPDFDESYDFFTVENRFNNMESVRVNLVK